MVTRLNKGQVAVHGKYNDSKTRLLVVLYVYRYWIGQPHLTTIGLAHLASVSIPYLNTRLPVFAGRRKSPLTGRFWAKERLLVTRTAAERSNRPVFLYALSIYGRHWIEDCLPRETFWQYIDKINLRKYAPNHLTLVD
jgi:hypothetical protein